MNHNTNRRNGGNVTAAGIAQQSNYPQYAMFCSLVNHLQHGNGK